jgi:hypothetical protein
MLRHSVRVLVLLGLLVVGWAAGHAQTSQVPDFELLVSTSNGNTDITCVRGCTLTWVAKSQTTTSSVEFHVATPTVRGKVTPAGCVAGELVLGSCRIWGWKK